MNARELRFLYDYNAWANQRVLEACAALSDAQIAQDLHASFQSIRGTLAHIMGGEWVWLERCEGRTVASMPQAEEFATLTDIRSRWAAIEKQLMKLVQTLAEADLSRKIEYRNFAGNPFAYPLGAILQHVVNHSTYHRGQIANLLRQIGAAPRATDLLRYYDFLAGNPED
ncbi:MAG: DinB family protein [Candidatus Acidiferrales bacterium]